MWPRRVETLLVFGTLFLPDAYPWMYTHRQAALGHGLSASWSIAPGCHGADGKGGDKAPPLVSASNTTSHSDSELFHIVHDGTKGGMSPLAQIGEANIGAVLQYLRRLQENASPNGTSSDAAVTGDVDAGRTLYFGKAQCSTCHLMQGKGGFMARNLTAYGRNRTADEILRALTTPDTPLMPSSQVVTVTTKTGQKLTGPLRNEDAFTLEVQTEDGRYHMLARSDVTDVHYTEHS